MTSTELIAVLALLVALAGPISAWVIARSRNDAEARMAAVARMQERRATLYVDILTFAATIEDWTNRTRPIATIAGEPGPPDLPDDHAQRVLRARTRAHASRLVDGLLNKVRASVSEFIKMVWILESVERSGAPLGEKTLMDHWNDLELARKAVREAVNTLERRVNDELSFVSKKDPPTPLGTIYAQPHVDQDSPRSARTD